MSSRAYCVGRCLLALLVLVVASETVFAFDLKAYPAAQGQINLTWTDYTFSDLPYRVERSTDASSWSQLGSNLPPHSTSYNDTTVTAKQRYYYRVGVVGSGSVLWSSTTWAVAVYTGGPLWDWIDVTQLHFECCAPFSDSANPNDTADDTCAIQKALNLLNALGETGNGRRVLYFPNGTYLISRTLFLENVYGAELIGESPGGVILKWVGDSGSINAGVVTAKVMFHSKSNYWSVFRNLVFDGGQDEDKHYVVAFDHSACTNNCGVPGNGWYTLSTSNHGSVGTAIFDSTFQHAWIGLRISHYNYQDSDIAVRRSQFLANDFGVSVEDFNALQIHFWDCKWDQNRYRGITNYIRNFGGASNNWAGDFTVERGRFTNNGQDIYYAPTGNFRVRDSWSHGSGMFIYGHGQSAVPGRMVISNNFVDQISPEKLFDDYDTAIYDNLHRGRAIANMNAGAIMLLDNTFGEPDTSDDYYDPDMAPIYAHTFTNSRVLALSNKYFATPFYEVDELTGDGSDVTDSDPGPNTIQDMPEPEDIFAGRPVFTVTNANNAQDVIDSAVIAAQSEDVVVHFPTDVYSLTSTLTIPSVPNDLVVTGSGVATRLEWYGSTPGTMINVDGYHAKTTLRDLRLQATNGEESRADGVVVADVNAASTRVFMSRVGAYQPRMVDDPATSGIHLNKADLTKVDVFNLNLLGYADRPNVVYDDNLFRLTAGPQTQATKSIWSSNTVASKHSFVGTNGPQGMKWLIAFGYMEQSQYYLDVSGSGGDVDVSVIGTKMGSMHTTDTAVVRITDVPGNVAIASSLLLDGDPNAGAVAQPSTLPPTGAIIEQSGTGSVDIESIGNSFYTSLGMDVSGTNASFTRAADKVHVCDEDHTHSSGGQEFTLDQCFNYCEIGQSGTYELCDQQPGPPDCGDDCETFADMSDIWTSTNPTPTSADFLPLYAGLNLYRNTEVPGYYDESGEQEPYQVNLDNLQVYNPINGVRIEGGIPDDPTELFATPFSPYVVDLTWIDNSSNEDGFRVTRATSTGGPYAFVADVGPGEESYSNTDIADGTDYWYRVVAFRSTTGESGFAQAGPVRTPLANPIELSGQALSGRKNRVQWTDRSFSETGFDIRRSVKTNNVCGTSYTNFSVGASSGSGQGVTFDNIGSGSTPPIAGTKYCYWVRSKNALFTTNTWVGPVTITTLP